jgi:molybdate transport system substrate-binding protein
MTLEIRIISSMATQHVLADLVAQYRQSVAPQQAVAVESVGGLDAAKRVQAGEAFDVVVLAANAIDQLIAAGHVVPGSRVDIVQLGVAVAVRAGAPRPDIGSEAALKAAVLAARSVGYSTGPSGVQLAKLFERWGIADAIASRVVQAPPGVPVGSLVVKGDVDLGFQQLSELIHLPGITVLGPLPPAVQVMTTFSAGTVMGSVKGSVKGEAVRALLAFMVSPAAEAAKRVNGMAPV